MTEQFKKGQLVLLQILISFTEKELLKLKAFPVIEGNPNCITRGGMIKAYKNSLQKLKVKQQKLINYKKC